MEKVGAGLDDLASRVPGVRSLTHGIDVGLSGGAHDYLVVIDVESVATFRTLRAHPAYVLLIEELFTGHVVDTVDGQLRIDDRSAGSPDDVDVRGLSDDELMARARRAAQASMDALMAEPDEEF